MDDKLKIFVTAVELAKSYDDCCPDVGMGPSLTTLMHQVEVRSGVLLTDTERELVLEELEPRNRR